ncbi:hypothetical protein [Streptomyces colonosanans]|uniref:Uncharacterized protein n=1 Tax=Streptomyces colonosanans TaxID=1428652 RepID=A0A1S2PDD1_9ACTN|nr:hypothetical protein [Streptomyces colonosanans]OIJ91670.1 hypothetical protein BIV24_15565 [Streptomyces colonosanans]
MKTCHQFNTIRAEYEREIGFMVAHSNRHDGSPAAKSSAKQAASTKQRMARALNSHVGHCTECG